jgi:hypothetical protein
MGKGGRYVYTRAPCDRPENMKLEKLILEKKKNKFEKMKISKFNPYSPIYPLYKKIQ